jgi:MASE1 protein
MGATVAANLAGDRNLASTIVFALCNAGEAVLTAWLIGRQFGSGFSLNSFRRVLGLLAAASIATAVSGIGGTLGFVLFHGATAPLTTWYHWFAADALGIVTVAPLVIGLTRSVQDLPRPLELVEGAAALVVLGAVSVIGFALPPTYWITHLAARLAFAVAVLVGCPLQTGVHRGGCICYLLDDCLDDYVRHRPLGGPECSTCRPCTSWASRIAGHHLVCAGCRGAVRRAASARGITEARRGTIARGAERWSRDGL